MNAKNHTKMAADLEYIKKVCNIKNVLNTNDMTRPKDKDEA